MPGTKYTEFWKSRGIYPFVDADPVQGHLSYLHTRISYAEIGRRAGVSAFTVRSQGRKKYGKATRELAAKLMAVRLTPDDLTEEERLVGAQRIMRGLLALGFNYEALADLSDVATQAKGPRQGVTTSLVHINAGKYHPSPDMYKRLLRAAEKLEGTTPEDHGVAPRGGRGNITKARKKGWAPLGCWDLDTIHMIDAHPDWTGACGTIEGATIHRREKTKYCPPCLAAYRKEKWHAEDPHRNDQGPV